MAFLAPLIGMGASLLAPLLGGGQSTTTNTVQPPSWLANSLQTSATAGNPAMTQMQGQLGANVAQNYSNAAGQANQAMASSGYGSAPSGLQASLQSALSRSAAQSLSSGETGLAAQNAQFMQQAQGQAANLYSKQGTSTTQPNSPWAQSLMSAGDSLQNPALGNMFTPSTTPSQMPGFNAQTNPLNPIPGGLGPNPSTFSNASAGGN